MNKSGRQYCSPDHEIGSPTGRAQVPALPSEATTGFKPHPETRIRTASQNEAVETQQDDASEELGTFPSTANRRGRTGELT